MSEHEGARGALERIEAPSGAEVAAAARRLEAVRELKQARPTFRRPLAHERTPAWALREAKTVPPLHVPVWDEAPRLRRTRRVPVPSAKFLLDGAGWPFVQLAFDVATLALAVWLATAAAQVAGPSAHAAAWLWLYPVLAAGLMCARGLHTRRRWSSVFDVVVRVCGALSVGAMALITLAALTAASTEIPRLVAHMWFFSIGCVSAGRVVLMVAQRRARASRRVTKRTLLVGGGKVGERVARRLQEHPEWGLEPVAVLDPDPRPRSQFPLPVVGCPDEMYEAAVRMRAEHVILAFSQFPDRHLVSDIRRCEEAGIQVSMVPRLFESVNRRLSIEQLGPMPLLGLHSIDPKGWHFSLKYALDRILAALLLILLAPLMLLIAVAIRLTSRGPVLFRQRRVGLDGQVFDLLKFRSMRCPDDMPAAFRPAEGLAPGGIEGVDRRTTVGKLLRQSFLDELPQLFNVLRGEMSLIGPRPERPEYVDLFGRQIERYGDRHRAKSGITGWAQVNGLRGQTSLADRIEFDNHYIQNWSLSLDLKVLLLTLPAALRNLGKDC